MKEDMLTDITGDMEQELLEQFLENNESKAEIKTDFYTVENNYEWLDKIEETMPYIDNFIRNPKKFLKQEEDVVPVELAKKTSTESVRHLAQNTRLIQKYDPVTEEIMPSNLLTIRREETFEVYENRFIYTLLRHMIFFMEHKKETESEGSFSKAERFLNYESVTTVNNEKIKMNLDIVGSSFEDLTRVDENGEDIKSRMKKIELFLGDWMKNEFCVELRNSLEVRSPIRKTNAILKNPNLQKALILWEYLENYEYMKRNETVKSNVEENPKGLLDKMEFSFFLNYAILNSISDTSMEKEERLNRFYIRRMVRAFLSKNKGLDLAKFKSMVNQEFKAINRRQKEYEHTIIIQLNVLTRKYGSQLNKCEKLLNAK